MAKHLCTFCKKKNAQWTYMPGGDDYWCDDCISSPDDQGCSCNWHYADPEAYHPRLEEGEIPEGIEGKDWRKVKDVEGAWQYLDEKGRPYPCCEFDYSEEGYEIEVKILLTEEQKNNFVAKCSKNDNFINSQIEFDNGSIIEEYVIDNSYFYCSEELNMTEKNIINITPL